MRISDWSSDVCSSDLELFSGAWGCDTKARRIGDDTRGFGRRYRVHGPRYNCDKGGRRVARPCPQNHALKERPRGIRGSDQKIRSEEHTSELQSLMRISYAVFCLKKKTNYNTICEQL